MFPQVFSSLLLAGIIVTIGICTHNLSSQASTLNQELPIGEKLAFELVSVLGNASYFEDTFNVLNAFMANWGNVVRFKNFAQIKLFIGGAISYANASVETDIGYNRNTSFIYKNVFPAEYPFPLDVFPNIISTSRIIRPDITANLTSVVILNIQPNGLDIQVSLFIPDGSPEQDNNIMWVFNPFTYNYIINL